ncbi:MAG: hypothetical protein KDK27_15330, partial [Leptospiraceae bacterium]|nr:hypothetical protein [Leptospiraceae bacterium]
MKPPANVFLFMRLRLSRSFYRLIILIILLAMPFPLGWYIEYRVNESLNLDEIHTRFQSVVERRTGLQAISQGGRYRLFSGIILQGVKLYRQNADGTRDYVLQTENLILEISPWDIFGSEYIIDSIRIEGGKCSPGLLNVDEYKQLAGFVQSTESGLETESIGSEEPSAPPTTSTYPVRISSNISVQAKALRLETDGIEAETTTAAGTFETDFKFTRSDTMLLAEAQVYIRNQNQSDATIAITGNISPDHTRFDFQIQDVALDFFLDALKFLPGEFSRTDEDFYELRAARGEISGTGSYDAYLDRGAGLNLELQFQNLNLQALYGTTTIFRLRDGAGRIHYNAGWATTESDYSFARLHFDHPLFNVNVETSNDPLSSVGNGRRTDAVHTVRVQGHLNADGKRLTYFDLPSRGRLNINYQHAHSEQDTFILPHFEIELKNVLISTVGELRDLFETDAELRIKHALMSRKSGPTAPLEFSANGDYD